MPPEPLGLPRYPLRVDETPPPTAAPARRFPLWAVLAAVGALVLVRWVVLPALGCPT
jgi:hypothetical protein